MNTVPKPTYARIPLLLSCGHSVCERCIRRETELNSRIQCGQCSTVQENVSKNVHENFPVNFHLLGLIFYNRNHGISKDGVDFEQSNKFQRSNIAAKFNNPPKFDSTSTKRKY